MSWRARGRRKGVSRTRHDGTHDAQKRIGPSGGRWRTMGRERHSHNGENMKKDGLRRKKGRETESRDHTKHQTLKLVAAVLQALIAYIAPPGNPRSKQKVMFTCGKSIPSRHHSPNPFKVFTPALGGKPDRTRVIK